MRLVLRTVAVTTLCMVGGVLLAMLLPQVVNRHLAGWQLEFTHLQNRLLFWGVTTACAATIGAILTLFRYEQQLISQRLGLGLLCLRISLVLFLYLMLLNPVSTSTRSERIEGRVLVAFDVSESMDTHDTQASLAEKLHWARAIGMLGNPEIRERVSEWLTDLDAGKEPQWATAAEEPDDDRRSQLALTRESMVRSLLQELQQFSRLDLARRAFLQTPDNPQRQLQELGTLQHVVFAEDAAALTEQQLTQFIAGTIPVLERTQSNLSEPAVAASAQSSRTPLAGVIVLSDGHDTVNESTDRLLTRLKRLDVPVHTVLVGSEHRPQDLSILHIDYPRSVFKSDQAQIKGILQTSGFERQPIGVFVDDLDDPDSVPLQQTITPEGPSAEVIFTLKDLEEGRHRFRLRTEVAEGETREDNNSRDFVLNVVDDRARVLLVDGSPRWEFRFLDAALSRDDHVSLSRVLFEQPFIKVLAQSFIPDQLPAATAGNSTFAPFDVVLLGDVSPEDFPPARWVELDRYVREEGGTLVLSAGQHFFPGAFHDPLLSALLPIEQLQTVVVENAIQAGPPPVRGFRLNITADGEQLPMFQLANDPAESRRIWSHLPGHPWGIAGRAKGSATVWATLPAGFEPNLERERENAIIVQHYVGTGQVVWIGIDSTWRWRYLVGDLYHHRFWGQLARWAVTFKASAGNENVKFGLQASVIDVGEPAVIQARWNEVFLQRHPDLQVEAIVERRSFGDSVIRTIPLAPRSGKGLLYEGVAQNLPAGEYSVRLKVSGADNGGELPEVPLLVNPKISGELRDVSANRHLLEEIAAATGGEFLLLDQLDRLPGLFSDIGNESTQQEVRPVWSQWPLLLLFFAIAMCEWTIRKFNGLP
ncbi:hypothetical protein [Planctomicrobium sp. SH664]|uniref:hypothetical protein n=1 Tax=Planctomicrobium sp. SH664 TaxID=3448125 RepID=UPI003F5C732B